VLLITRYFCGIKGIVLDVRGVTKRYGSIVALDGVDLEIQPGEVLGLLGPNGAGKTSLLSIVATLQRADSGVVRVCGIDVADDPANARRHLGFAPQELGVYPLLTVRENLAFFGEVAGLRSRALARRIDEVAEELDIATFMNRRVQALSGGEKRRVHTAMALLHRPPLLLLDEPTTGVDVSARARFIETVRGLAASGSAVCYSTHYLPEVEALGAAVAIIDKGRLIARGTVGELVRRYSCPALDLLFDGPVPQRLQHIDGVVRPSDNRVIIHCAEPALEAARLLADLGDEARRVSDLQLIVPSLEAVFLSLTGRTFEAEVEGAVGTDLLARDDAVVDLA
jgi:ABC-2 type transport system ATP-binding protein